MLGMIVDFKDDLPSLIEDVKQKVTPLKDSKFLFASFAMQNFFINHLPKCIMEKKAAEELEKPRRSISLSNMAGPR